MPDGSDPIWRRRLAPLSLIWLDEIEPVLAAADFVQGVLVEGSAGVVYGESNSGKTFLLTDLALHVAAGLPWQGRRVEQGGVVYCAMEGGNGFRNRVAAWRDANGSRELPFAAIPVSLNLLDPDADAPALIVAIKAAERRIGQPVKLVVLDTLSRAMAGGNENDSADMGALVANVDRIRADTGACVVFVHHSGKDAARGARGHSLLRAAIDTEIEVRVDEDSGARTATVVKQRDLAKGCSFGFRLEVVTLGQNQHGEDVTTCLVTAADAGVAKPSRSITEAERGWHRDLVDMFAEPDMPRQVAPLHGMDPCLTLTREQVRAGFRRRGRFTCEPDANLTGADRERMRSMLGKLRDKGKIGLSESLIWLIEPRQVASGPRHD